MSYLKESESEKGNPRCTEFVRVSAAVQWIRAGMPVSRVFENTEAGRVYH